MRTISKEELKELYHKDFPLWVEINLEFLKEKAYDLVDWENLLEEIEDMARTDLKACRSHLATILEHLYKWDNFRKLTKAGEEKGGLSWIITIELARKEIEYLFEEYPSLRVKLPKELNSAWKEASLKLMKWLAKIGEDPKDYHIPEKCPYTYEEAMTRDLRKEIKR
jgi:hypothetical protein